MPLVAGTSALITVAFAFTSMEGTSLEGRLGKPNGYGYGYGFPKKTTRDGGGHGLKYGVKYGGTPNSSSHAGS